MTDSRMRDIQQEDDPAPCEPADAGPAPAALLCQDKLETHEGCEVRLDNLRELSEDRDEYGALYHVVRGCADSAFRALAVQLFEGEKHHPVVRRSVVNHVARHWSTYAQLTSGHADAAEYRRHMEQDGARGGLVEVRAAGEAFYRSVAVVHDGVLEMAHLISNGEKPLVLRQVGEVPAEDYDACIALPAAGWKGGQVDIAKLEESLYRVGAVAAPDESRAEREEAESTEPLDAAVRSKKKAEKMRDTRQSVTEEERALQLEKDSANYHGGLQEGLRESLNARHHVVEVQRFANQTPEVPEERLRKAQERRQRREQVQDEGSRGGTSDSQSSLTESLEMPEYEPKMELKDPEQCPTWTVWLEEAKLADAPEDPETDRLAEACDKGAGSRLAEQPPKPVDFADEYGAVYKSVRRDGNCVFRAFALKLFHDEKHHRVVRRGVVNHVLNNWWSTYAKLTRFANQDTYRRFMERDGSPGGAVEVRAAAEAFYHTVGVVQDGVLEVLSLRNDADPIVLRKTGEDPTVFYDTCVILPPGGWKRGDADMIALGWRILVTENRLPELSAVAGPSRSGQAGAGRHPDEGHADQLVGTAGRCYGPARPRGRQAKQKALEKMQELQDIDRQLDVQLSRPEARGIVPEHVQGEGQLPPWREEGGRLQVQPTLVQPTLVQPTLVQPTLVQPTLVQPWSVQGEDLNNTPGHIEVPLGSLVKLEIEAPEETAGALDVFRENESLVMLDSGPEDAESCQNLGDATSDDDVLPVGASYTDEFGAVYKAVTKDGECVFRALAARLFSDESHHAVVRTGVFKHIDQNWEDYAPLTGFAEFTDYKQFMSEEGHRGGLVEVRAAGEAFYRTVAVVQEGVIELAARQDDRDPIVLRRSGQHYDPCITVPLGGWRGAQDDLVKLYYRKEAKTPKPVAVPSLGNHGRQGNGDLVEPSAETASSSASTTASTAASTTASTTSSSTASTTAGTTAGTTGAHYTDEFGAVYKAVRKDANCIFRALAEQVFGCEKHHQVVRTAVLNHVLKNWEPTYRELTGFERQDSYRSYMERLGSGGVVEARAAGEGFFRTVAIVQDGVMEVATQQKRNPIVLRRIAAEPADHYDVCITLPLFGWKGSKADLHKLNGEAVVSGPRGGVVRMRPATRPQMLHAPPMNPPAGETWTASAAGPSIELLGKNTAGSHSDSHDTQSDDEIQVIEVKPVIKHKTSEQQVAAPAPLEEMRDSEKKSVQEADSGTSVTCGGEDCTDEFGGLYKTVRRDGNCVFRALAVQLFEDEKHHPVVRRSVVNHVVNKWPTYAQLTSSVGPDAYRGHMEKEGARGSAAEVRAAGEAFYRTIGVVQDGVLEVAALSRTDDNPVVLRRTGSPPDEFYDAYITLPPWGWKGGQDDFDKLVGPRPRPPGQAAAPVKPTQSPTDSKQEKLDVNPNGSVLQDEMRSEPNAKKQRRQSSKGKVSKPSKPARQQAAFESSEDSSEQAASESSGDCWRLDNHQSERSETESSADSGGGKWTRTTRTSAERALTARVRKRRENARMQASVYIWGRIQNETADQRLARGEREDASQRRAAQKQRQVAARGRARSPKKETPETDCPQRRRRRAVPRRVRSPGAPPIPKPARPGETPEEREVRLKIGRDYARYMSRKRVEERGLEAVKEERRDYQRRYKERNRERINALKRQRCANRDQELLEARQRAQQDGSLEDRPEGPMTQEEALAELEAQLEKRRAYAREYHRRNKERITERRRQLAAERGPKKLTGERLEARRKYRRERYHRQMRKLREQPPDVIEAERQRVRRQKQEYARLIRQKIEEGRRNQDIPMDLVERLERRRAYCRAYSQANKDKIAERVWRRRNNIPKGQKEGENGAPIRKRRPWRRRATVVPEAAATSGAVSETAASGAPSEDSRAAAVTRRRSGRTSTTHYYFDSEDDADDL